MSCVLSQSREAARSGFVRPRLNRGLDPTTPVDWIFFCACAHVQSRFSLSAAGIKTSCCSANMGHHCTRGAPHHHLRACSWSRCIYVDSIGLSAVATDLRCVPGCSNRYIREVEIGRSSPIVVEHTQHSSPHNTTPYLRSPFRSHSIHKSSSLSFITPILFNPQPKPFLCQDVRHPLHHSHATEPRPRSSRLYPLRLQSYILARLGSLPGVYQDHH